MKRLNRPTCPTASNFDENENHENASFNEIDAALDDDATAEQIDPIDEEITAYLDDELSSEERAAFERRLADDPDLRRRVDEERSAWNALELLDAVPPNATLTETTVYRLNAETQTELKTLEHARTRRRRLQSATNYGIAALLTLAGFFFFSRCFPDVQTLRERDCRVVERLAQLETVGDFDYLTALDRSKLFAEPRPVSFFGGFDATERTFEKRPRPDSSPRAETPTHSTAELKTFDELSQDRVFYRLQQKFERLDPKTRQSRRDFYRQIADAPNAERLWIVLDNYCDWISAWPNVNDRERLLTLPVDQRVAEIQRLLTPFERRSFEQPFASQRPDPNASFKKTFEPSPTIKAFRSALPEELRSETLVPLYQKYAEFLKKRGRDGNERREGVLAFLTEIANDELLANLSPNAQKYLERLSEEERMSALGLLVSLSVCEAEERSFTETRPFQHNFGLPFGARPKAFNGAKIGGEMEPFRSDSIAELAETLRKSPQEIRDFLTSRPADEMRGRLWALHWGFAQFGGPVGGERDVRWIGPPTSYPNAAPRPNRRDESAASPNPTNKRPLE